MNIITKNLSVYDNFVVLNGNNIPVTDLIQSDFIIRLYNPNLLEVSSSCSVAITEIGNGLYRVSFIPNLVGNWLLTIYHTVYFPIGKMENYSCIESAFDDLQIIKGLVQHNYRLFNTTYIIIGDNVKMSSALVKLYTTAFDCENDINPIKTYQLQMTYDSEGKIIDYQSKEL